MPSSPTLEGQFEDLSQGTSLLPPASVSPVQALDLLMLARKDFLMQLRRIKLDFMQKGCPNCCFFLDLIP
jgi:hypothetical protein